MSHHTHSDKDTTSLVAGVAILSAVVGAFTALLFAPKAGSQTRQEMRDRIAAAKADMKTKFNTSKDSLDDDVSSAGQAVDEAVTNAKEQVKDAAKDVKPTTRRKADDAPDLTDEVRKNGER